MNDPPVTPRDRTAPKLKVYGSDLSRAARAALTFMEAYPGQHERIGQRNSCLYVMPAEFKQPYLAVWRTKAGTIVVYEMERP